MEEDAEDEELEDNEDEANDDEESEDEEESEEAELPPPLKPISAAAAARQAFWYRETLHRQMTAGDAATGINDPVHADRVDNLHGASGHPGGGGTVGRTRMSGGGSGGGSSGGSGGDGRLGGSEIGGGDLTKFQHDPVITRSGEQWVQPPDDSTGPGDPGKLIAASASDSNNGSGGPPPPLVKSYLRKVRVRVRVRSA